jgi:hypothetical protein
MSKFLSAIIIFLFLAAPIRAQEPIVVDDVPLGAILMFDKGQPCPDNWEEFVNANSRYLRSLATVSGETVTGGSSSHSHELTTFATDTSATELGDLVGNPPGATRLVTWLSTGSATAERRTYVTNAADNLPLYYNVLLCRKTQEYVLDIPQRQTLTDTYHIDIRFSEFGVQPALDITKTLVDTYTASYSGTVSIPKPFDVYNPIAVLAMFLVFTLAGSAAGKPTMFLIAFIGLMFSGVLTLGGNYVTYPMVVLGAGLVVYRLVYWWRQR